MIRAHEKLEIYRLAHELAVRVHRLTVKLPRFEQYEEGGQMRRSSKSVSSQIVEGHALRRYKAEYLRYLARAYASAEETMEHLTFVRDTALEESVAFESRQILSDYEILCRKMNSYRRVIMKRRQEKGASR